MEEAAASQAEIEQLKQQREAEVHSSCFALEELQAELQDAHEELEQERKARELDLRESSCSPRRSRSSGRAVPTPRVHLHDARSLKPRTSRCKDSRAAMLS